MTFSWQSERANYDWRILAGRKQGTSHLVDNTPCEDYYCAKSIGGNLFIFVADGAGSASHGGDGAKIACESAMNFAQSITFFGNKLTDHKAKDIAKNIVEYVQTTLSKYINRLNQHNQKNSKECSDLDGLLTLRDFSCTFLGVLVIDNQTLLMQIGDGAIILNFEQNIQGCKSESGLIVPIRPMQGEYANMTNFITESKALDYLATKTYQRKPKQVVVMTDGLQRLALNLTTFTPHPPFFAPFFRALENTQSSHEGRQALQSALDSFLDSQSVNSRTDDDKTLVLVQVV